MAEIKIDSEELVYLNNMVNRLKEENDELKSKLHRADENFIKLRIKEDAVKLFNTYVSALFHSVGVVYSKSIHYITQEDIADIFNGNSEFQIQVEIKEGVKSAYLKIVSFDNNG